MAGGADGQTSFKATKWLMGAMFALVGATFATRWFTWTVELVPERAELIFAIAGAAALVAGIGAVAMILWFRPELRWRPLPSAFVLGPLFALLTLLAMLRIVDAVLQRLDFSHAKIQRSQVNLAIGRAYTSSGKGWHYHVQLSEVFATLDVSKRDYIAAFGEGNDVRQGGWCLLAVIERSGDAVRVVLGKRWPFAAGKITHCPPGAGENVLLRQDTANKASTSSSLRL